MVGAMRDVVELAKALVSIESTTLREGTVGAFIADGLEADGWRVTRQEIPGGDPSVAAPRMNVLATLSEQPPKLVFTTHIDTVPPFIPLSEDAEFLYGRGTCDAKGIFAAEWIAAERLRALGHEDVALLAVVGEETDSIGAKRAAAILPAARWIVDGEPTGCVMTSAAKGFFSFRARARGVAGHSAYPERGRSALHALIRGLGRLIEAELPSEPSIGASTVNVGRVEGGLAANVIAPDAEAVIAVRLGTEVEPIVERVRALLGPDIEIDVQTLSPPQRIHVPAGYPSAPVSFGSDVPHLRSIGTPLLVGPGSIHDAHTAGEKIGKAELRAAVDLYTELGLRLLAE